MSHKCLQCTTTQLSQVHLKSFIFAVEAEKCCNKSERAATEQDLPKKHCVVELAGRLILFFVGIWLKESQENMQEAVNNCRSREFSLQKL